MISIRQLILIYFLIFIGLFGLTKTLSSSEEDDDAYILNNSTELNYINHYKDEFIFVNTIDGVLYAINKHNGDIKWSLNEDAVIRFPKNNDKPYFLTDPRDGSLYVSSSRDGLKKFPYTIPELVSASPSKSSDGYLYTGDKRDQWIAIDVLNGQKLDTLTADTLSTKTTTSNNLLYIGRTQYTISMFDINTRKRKFNVTYYDYSTHAADTIDESTFTEDPIKAQFSSSSSKKQQTDILNYPYYHFTSSSDGLIITVDKRSGEIVWQRRLNNPVVGMYQHLNDHLYKLNFAIFSIETLTSLAEESWQYKALFTDSSGAKDLAIKSIFTPTLYVGYYNENFYALPAFVFSAQIGPKFPRLPGPQPAQKPDGSGKPGLVKPPQKSDDKGLSTIPDNTRLVDNDNDDANKTFLGHHTLPASYSPNYINTELDMAPIRSSDFLANYFDKDKKQSPANCPITPKKERQFFAVIKDSAVLVYAVVIATIIPLAFICWERRNRRRMEETSRHSGSTTSNREYSNHSNHSNHSNSNSRHSTANGNNSNNTAVEYHTPQIVHTSMSCPDMKDGLIKIGKILYDPKALLGHGSEGTFVYKGLFEDRAIAVKRILPECYTLADREVELLRDADQHPNVLRYFCMEADAQFRYIALELCQLTLQSYVSQKDEFTKIIKPLTVLEQATNGLAHLHTLGIVHRDIKPHNVLLSFPNGKGEIVAKISDFGLCKRLDTGCTSYSKRSGITGTEGWIAPELLDDASPHYKDSFTKSVDIFSLGCLYYYVLTFGMHPFGDHLRRQANILSNQYKLDLLVNYNFDSYIQKTLIEKMISVDPKQRPSAKSLVIHPVFWSKAKILQFLQDVSDRIEKINPDDPILLNLEKNANAIIRNNWKVHICAQLQDDLKKFRSYNGVSVRDLLRAIRNKKHHYRELSDPVKQSLGALPDEFVDYFTSRFPKLILHTYEAMRTCKDEAMIDVYYNEN